MYGMPSSEVISPRRSAMFMACASLSITQGPAIRNKGASPPKRIFPAEKFRGESIYVVSQDTRRTRLCGFVVVFNFELRTQTTLPQRRRERKSKRVKQLIRGGIRSGHTRFRGHALAALTIFHAGAAARGEQRMRGERLGLEFGMELATEKPRMIWRFHNFDVDAVRRTAGDAETGAR